MAGLIPIGELQAAGDLTTADLLWYQSRSRDAVDARVTVKTSEALVEAVAQIPEVADAAAAYALAGAGVMVMATGVNLVGNPLPADASGWNSNPAGGTVVATIETVGGPDSVAGPTSFRRLTWTAASTLRQNLGQYYGTAAGRRINVQAGKKYSMGFKLRVNKKRRQRMQISWLDAAGVEITTVPAGPLRRVAKIVEANVWTQFKLEGVTAPAGAAFLVIYMFEDYTTAETGFNGPFEVGDTHDVSQVQAHEGILLPDFYAGGVGGTWSGTANNSPSTRKERDAAPAATVNDLAVLEERIISEYRRRDGLGEIARLAKGGVIGIGDKGAIAIRCDDWHIAFRDVVRPRLEARGIPCALASISRLYSWHWAAGITGTDVRNWNRRGVEIWSHGTDHNDPTIYGDAGLVDQIVTSKAELEAWDVKVQGWMAPGATPLYPPTIPYGFDGTIYADTWLQRAGRLIRGTYALSEDDAPETTYRNLPTGTRYSLNHVTISDGMSKATALGNINYAVQHKLGLELMIHAGNIGLPGNITIADLEEILDTLVSLWDAGDIEILTPSGLAFADHSDQRVRLDLPSAAGFETAVTGSGAGWVAGDWSGVTIETTGGHSGSRFARFSGATQMEQVGLQVLRRGFSGETFLFEGWARPSGASAVGKVRLYDIDNLARFDETWADTILPAGSPGGNGWTRVRHPFTVAPGTDRITLAIGRTSGDPIDWDDIRITKV